ncbi:MAG: hypothetical protein ABDH66_00200 [Bacteroidia bacterium]
MSPKQSKLWEGRLSSQTVAGFLISLPIPHRYGVTFATFYKELMAGRIYT